MQANIVTMKDLEHGQESHGELDTISEIKVFDVVYEVALYSFYFRCTKSMNENIGQENTIELLQDDSDYCDDGLYEYMTDKITDIYL